MARTILGAVVVALLLLLCGALFSLRQAMELRAPPVAPQRITVADGESLSKIATRLQSKGILTDRRVFLLLARWRSMDRQIRSGSYDFSGNATAGEVLDALVSGPQSLDFVSIPEGWTAEQIAVRLEAAGLGKASRYRELIIDPEFSASLGVPADRLEGYLFPDTYSFGPSPNPEDVLRRMTERFFEVFGAELESQAVSLSLSPHEIVTLASIVEAEAAVASERPRISAVFHNRLRLGMPLQADPTVLYGVEGRQKPIRRSDLKRKTPYNTYVIRGLPPGPIANPGLAALRATVAPTPDSKDLYFVARNDRTHVFSKSLAAHTRAVRRYQR